MRVTGLYGVYNADGSVRGELAYVLGKLTGRAHCELCDITHGRLRRRPEYDDAAAALPMPMELLHRDELERLGGPPAELPCVVATTDEGLVVLLDRAAIAACGTDPARLVGAVRDAAAARGLRWDD